MDFQRKDWQFRDFITEGELNRMEGGIEEGITKAEQAQQTANEARQTANEAKATADAAQSDLSAHASATTGVHGATSAATPNTIIQRDYAGRAKVAAPAAADDIARKDTVDAVQANLNNHINNPTGAHPASAISIADAGGNFTSTDVEGALAELFQSVSDGKNQLETAIADKGGTVSKTGNIATFDELDNGIRSIPVGDYAVGDTINDSVLMILSGGMGTEIWSKTDVASGQGIAVDSAGNVYCLSRYDEEVERVLQELQKKITALEKKVAELEKKQEPIPAPAWFVREFGSADLGGLINDPDGKKLPETWEAIALAARMAGIGKK